MVVGPRDTASARLQGFLIAEWLRGHTDIDVRLLHAPQRYTAHLPRRAWVGLIAGWLRGLDVVVFQKVAGPQAGRMMRVCRALGIGTIFFDCDARDSYDFAHAASRLAAASRGMADDIAAKTGRPCEVIPDPVEFWRDPAEAPPPDRWLDLPLRLVWIGGSQNLPQAFSLRARLEALPDPPATITTIADSPSADIPWRLDALPGVLYGFDAGVIPVSGDPDFHLKSLNRATLFMAISVPLLVEANTAYSPLVRDGENALVWREPAEFGAACRRLADPEIRARVIRGGYRAAQAYHIDSVGRQWATLIEDVSAAVRRRGSRPKARSAG